MERVPELRDNMHCLERRRHRLFRLAEVGDSALCVAFLTKIIIDFKYSLKMPMRAFDRKLVRCFPSFILDWHAVFNRCPSLRASA